MARGMREKERKKQRDYNTGKEVFCLWRFQAYHLALQNLLLEGQCCSFSTSALLSSSISLLFQSFNKQSSAIKNFQQEKREEGKVAEESNNKDKVEVRKQKRGNYCGGVIRQQYDRVSDEFGVHKKEQVQEEVEKADICEEYRHYLQ